jgi:hypothetical protein
MKTRKLGALEVLESFPPVAVACTCQSSFDRSRGAEPLASFGLSPFLL